MATAVYVPAIVALEAGVLASFAPVILGSGIAILGWKAIAWWKAAAAKAEAAKAAAAVAAKAAAVAAADTASTAAAAGAATVSLPVALAGVAIAAVVVGGASYLYKRNKAKRKTRNQRRRAARNAADNPVPRPAGSPSDPDEPSDDDEDSLARKKQNISISKNEMKDLLRRCGRQIWEKLKEKGRPGYQGTIWRDREYRVDAGSTLRDRPRVMSWNLQVNREASRQVRRGRDTHQRLFWDGFDLDNVPEYEAWVRSIMDRFM